MKTNVAYHLFFIAILLAFCLAPLDATTHVKFPEEYNKPTKNLKVFLAGCSSDNWQTQFIHLVGNVNAIFFDLGKCTAQSDDFQKQIAWENHYINSSKVVVFWFPEHNLNTDAILELGRVSVLSDKVIFVGIYPLQNNLKQEIVAQLRTLCPKVKIVNSLGALAVQVKDYIKNH